MTGCRIFCAVGRIGTVLSGSQGLRSAAAAVRRNTFYSPPLFFGSTIRRMNNNTTAAADIDKMLKDERRHFDYEDIIARKMDGAVVIVDVRQPEELAATGTIPNSINIPLAELDNALSAMTNEEFHFKYGTGKPPLSTLLVFSCQSGRRSVSALSTALHHGYLNSANYKGGWLDWEKHTVNPQPQPPS